MTANYDASVVGVPYIRGTQVVINWPDQGGMPVGQITQCMAVKLADGTVRNLETIPPLTITLDLTNHGTDAIPLVNPSNGAPLGANTTLNTAMLNVLAVIRQAQIASGQ